MQNIKSNNPKLKKVVLEVIILGILGIFLSFSILSDSEVLAKYSKMESDTRELQRNLIVFMSLYFLMKAAYFKNKKIHFRLPLYTIEYKDKRIWKAFAISFSAAIFIQIILVVIVGGFLFQTANVSVFVFFVLAAITEEFMFRVVTAEAAYMLLARLKNEEYKRLIAAIVSGLTFALIHKNYYEQPLLLISVGLGGFVYAYILLKYRLELPAFLAHILNNAIAAGTLIQTLK